MVRYTYAYQHQHRKSGHDFIVEDRGYLTPCWVWQLAKTKSGYPITRKDGSNYLAHRLAYERKFGSIPETKELDHLCRVRCCVNPDHLEPVVHAINIRRGNTCKLNAETAEIIREEYNAPGKRYGRYSALARKYGVRYPTIRALIIGTTWKEPTWAE